MNIIVFVCPNSHERLVPIKAAEKDDITCNVKNCGQKMFKQGGEQPAASPATDVRQF